MYRFMESTETKIKIKLKVSPCISIGTTLIKPTLVQLKKKGGNVVNPYEVYIGRRISNPNWRLDESIWANPFKMKSEEERDIVVEQYRQYLLSKPDLLKQLPSLSGKILGCWCPADKKCHGKVIIELFEQKIWEKLNVQ